MKIRARTRCLCLTAKTADAKGAYFLEELKNAAYTDLEYEDLGENIRICISSEHRFGTDAFLLSDFAAPRHKDRVCDLCSGSGIVALLMYKRFRPAVIETVEIMEKAVALQRLSLERSGIEDIIPNMADLKDYRSGREFDVITCNPPYKTAGTGAQSSTAAGRAARHETLCNIDDICAAAKRNLKFGGRLCLCNRPQRLCDVMSAMRSNGIEPKRLRFVSKTPDSPPWLFLIEGRKGGGSFMQVEPQLFVQNGSGDFSDEIKRIYGQI